MTVCSDVPSGYKLTKSAVSPFALYSQTIVPGLPPGVAWTPEYEVPAAVPIVLAEGHVNVVAAAEVAGLLLPDDVLAAAVGVPLDDPQPVKTKTPVSRAPITTVRTKLRLIFLRFP